MTTDRLHARRRAVLAVAGLLGSDLAPGPWYLRVGGRFAGPVARVVSRHPLGQSETCTLEVGASTTAAMSALIDGACEDLTLFRGRSTGIVGFELSGARLSSITLPRRDAASGGEPAVQLRIAWQGRSISRLPDSYVVATESPAAADRARLTVRVDGQPVPAAWVGPWTMGGDLPLAVPGTDTLLAPGATRPVTVSVGRFTFAFAATLKSAQAPVFTLATQRAALQVSPA
jgi:hypothetical protein